MQIIFSNFGVIQTKLLNRLGLEKAAKLVSSYCELPDGAELYWWMSEYLCSILLFVCLIYII